MSNDLRNVRVGLEIFERHAGCSIAAGHDVIYAGQANGEVLTPGEVAALIAAEWMPDCEGCAEVGQPSFSCACGDREHAYTCDEWMIFT
jgi:hypothetical protein